MTNDILQEAPQCHFDTVEELHAWVRQQREGGATYNEMIKALRVDYRISLTYYHVRDILNQPVGEPELKAAQRRNGEDGLWLRQRTYYVRNYPQAYPVSSKLIP